jgi:hypothetical protein
VKVRPYHKQAQSGERDEGDGVERDERGLTRWHYGLGGRQELCGTCDQSPCDDRCSEQFKPDRLEWKAARAQTTLMEWARTHPDWVGWELHRDREDVAKVLEALAKESATAAEAVMEPAPQTAGPEPASPVLSPEEIFAAPSVSALAEERQREAARAAHAQACTAFLAVVQGAEPEAAEGKQTTDVIETETEVAAV